MNEVLKVLEEAFKTIERLHALLLMHDAEINDLRQQVKELQEHDR